MRTSSPSVVGAATLATLATLGAVGALAFGLAACDVGMVPPGGDPGTGDDDSSNVPSVDAAPPDYTVAVTPAASTTLGTSVDLMIDVEGSHWSGPVALAADGAPASWTVAIDPPTVDAADGVPVHATVHVTIPTNGDGAPSGQALTIHASGDPGVRAASSTVTVDNVYILAIGTPGASGQHFGALAGGQLRMKRGARLRITNTDAIPHRIHSDAGVDGFAHQDSSMPSGQAYEVTLQSTGSDLFYCHDHGQGTGEVRLTVQ
ncbi:MAG TPA: hypothetical protein VHE35_21805 [Kofleriaceae bacterium]|nr:hypothetical protein [Kofleriaceae bacterium]